MQWEFKTQSSVCQWHSSISSQWVPFPWKPSLHVQIPGGGLPKLLRLDSSTEQIAWLEQSTSDSQRISFTFISQRNGFATLQYWKLHFQSSSLTFSAITHDLVFCPVSTEFTREPVSFITAANHKEFLKGLWQRWQIDFNRRCALWEDLTAFSHSDCE